MKERENCLKYTIIKFKFVEKNVQQFFRWTVG